MTSPLYLRGTYEPGFQTNDLFLLLNSGVIN